MRRNFFQEISILIIIKENLAKDRDKLSNELKQTKIDLTKRQAKVIKNKDLDLKKEKNE